MIPNSRLLNIRQGDALPGAVRQVTQANINLYAEASGDFNPIHIDPEFAGKTQLGGTIAHGMLILAYVSEFMANSFGLSWLMGGKLNIRFKTAARPGDTLIINGSITKIESEDEHTLIYCDVLCQNQKSEPVIIGEAKVRVKK